MKTAFPWGKRHKFLQSSPETSTDTPFLQCSVHHHGCRHGGLEPSANKEQWLTDSTRGMGWRGGGGGVSDLWYEVQECISWEGPHCKTHKELQDEGVGLLTGVEEDEADTKHGAHCDDQHGHGAVAILWKDKGRRLHTTWLWSSRSSREVL